QMRPLLPAACLLALLLLGCRGQEPEAAASTVAVASPEEGGAVSTAPVQVVEDAGPEQEAAPEPEPDEPAIDWSPMDLAPDAASASSELDYGAYGNGEPLQAFGREAIVPALVSCAARGVLRLRYVGKINGGFVQAVQRETVVAEALDIGKRVPDIDSSGG